MVRNPPEKKIFRTSKRTRCLCRHCDRTLNTNSRLQSTIHGLVVRASMIKTPTLEIAEAKDFHWEIRLKRQLRQNGPLFSHYRIPGIHNWSILQRLLL